MRGIAPPRASARRSGPLGPGSTRCCRRWAAWTARTATAIWCACARPWRRMRWPQTETASESWNAGTMAREAFGPSVHLSICPSGLSGAENMAIDAGLLEQADQTGRALLRLYRFVPSCLSLGRNEPARKCYDRDAIARLGIDVVRRPTGGRAVWHEHEVTYAVAGPITAFGVDSGRGAACCAPTYRAIHRRLAAALRTLRVDAPLAPHPPPPPSTEPKSTRL